MGGGLGSAKQKRVYWQSYAVADPNTPTSHKYELFFDPFKAGPPYKTQNGSLNKRIDTDTPAGNYKYTIVGNDCTGAALDPLIRVQK